MAKRIDLTLTNLQEYEYEYCVLCGAKAQYKRLQRTNSESGGYHLGTYRKIEDAVKARQETEESIFAPAASHYEKWKKAAVLDPEWAKENPILFRVEKDYSGRWAVACAPDIESIERIIQNGGDET